MENEKGDAMADTLVELAEELNSTITSSGDRLLKYFKFAHLPEKQRAVSAGFARLALQVVTDHENSAERTAGLRKLLEAKDCIVRASLG